MTYQRMSPLIVHSPAPPDKAQLRTQFAALCYRLVKGKPEFLLITSRRSGRWIVPKGWPMKGRKPAKVALREAWEEAGVEGRALDHCLGLFPYRKVLADGQELDCVGLIYPIQVKSLAHSWPERGQRKRKWFSAKKAAIRVGNPELARIIKRFDPMHLRG